MHYLFFGQVNLSFDKYDILLVPRQVSTLLFQLACLYSTMFGSIGMDHIISESC